MGSRIFAPGLLDGRVAVVSGDGEAIAGELTGLGAQVERFALTEDEEAVDAFVDGALERHGAIDALVNRPDGKDFRVSVEGTWLLTHAVATKAMIPEERGGKIVNVSPADPVCRAALENLARVLSIEWARFGIRPTAIASGSDEEAAWLAAFLASPAGDYYSGAVLG
jgi:NAD(P)-dependent dehydrogenase (short-subunit alcohol dehydrogenase family)